MGNHVMNNQLNKILELKRGFFEKHDKIDILKKY
jgi:hypothetical protein